MSTRVLLIEDDLLDQQFVLRAMARSSGVVDIKVAENGAVSLEKLRREPLPSVIVRDLSLPRMDGHEFLLALTSD
ncbi:MAG: response regulator [Pseudomonadota bacterium]